MKAKFKGRTVDILPAAADRFGASDPARHEAEAPVSDEPSAPAQSASKGDWVEWAVSRGADHDEAQAATKADLIEQYGA